MVHTLILFILIIFFLLRPLITFYLFLILAFMLCNIYTEQILKSVTLFGIFARNVKGLEKLNNSNCTNIEMRNCLIQS